MRTDQFDFKLPEELIAIRPREPRDAARLMIIQPDGRIIHQIVKNLPTFLARGDLLVVNDTKVIRARLGAVRPSRSLGILPVPIEITLHRRLATNIYSAFAQPARRLRVGDGLQFSPDMRADVIQRRGGEIELQFDRGGADLDASIARIGSMPLPPYIAKSRPPDERDFDDYQTIYAEKDGSVAAPTAGLHFTATLLEGLGAEGIDRVALTLHVGAGTFLPVSGDDPAEHKMHPEWASIDATAAERINAVRERGGRLVAVGTTSLRTLESAAGDNGLVHPYSGETDIFITPGYRFKTADVLLTNFHLPRSTLFMLVSAFMGLDVMQKAYAEAIREKYRFYSYGDACLLFRSPT